MQHGVYTILSRWWTTRKKELKKQLEMWGATNKQDQVRPRRPITPSMRLVAISQ